MLAALVALPDDVAVFFGNWITGVCNLHETAGTGNFAGSIQRAVWNFCSCSRIWDQTDKDFLVFRRMVDGVVLEVSHDLAHFQGVHLELQWVHGLVVCWCACGFGIWHV